MYETWPRNPPKNNTLSRVDKMVHTRKRRVLSSAFTEKALHHGNVFNAIIFISCER